MSDTAQQGGVAGCEPVGGLMPDLDPPDLDLTTCDREPVHLAGAIQPHGALLVVTEPDLRVVQASTNAAAFLGLPAQSLVGQQLDGLLGGATTERLRERLAATNLTGVLAHLLGLPDRPQQDAPLHLFGNRIDGLLLLEFERAGDASRMAPGEGLFELRDSLQLLQQTTGLDDFLAALVARVRALTGFERVMAYRFDWDGSGEVVAEARRPGLETYLGLHYPAADIPEPARRLFTCSPLRHIPDVDYAPVPLLPETLPETGGRPVDLSYSFLRSVSPLHIAYLRNMGARATLVMPLIRRGGLWGLVACMHHSGPRYLPYERRVPLEVLSQTAALLLNQREDREHETYRARLDEALYRLTEALGREGPGPAALTGAGVNLLSAIEAGGAALIIDGQTTLLGQTPAAPDCALLAGWLAAEDEPVFATHQLGQVVPPAAAWRAVASGLLTVRLTGADRILWFRPEVVAEVRWAGDPHKPVVLTADDPHGRLQPRASFALWKESVRGQSHPWLDCERDHAARLRQAILLAIAERARVLARINAELARSNRELDAFAYAASHDLREPLRGIHNFTELLERGDGAHLSAQGLQRIGTIKRLANRMDELLASLLQYSQAFREALELDAFPLGDLVAEAVELACQAPPDLDLRITIQPDLPVVRCDRMRVVMIFHNLIANAIKYNDQAEKRIEIGGDTGVDPPVFFVRDNGIGIPAEHHELVFALFRRLHGRDQYGGGSGAGLTIAKQAIRRHQGRIWVESVPGQGSTFFFTLAPEGISAPLPS